MFKGRNYRLFWIVLGWLHLKFLFGIRASATARFSNPQISTPSLGPTKSLVQRVPASFSGSGALGVVLTAHTQLASWFKMGRAVLWSPSVPLRQVVEKSTPCRHNISRCVLSIRVPAIPTLMLYLPLAFAWRVNSAADQLLLQGVLDGRNFSWVLQSGKKQIYIHLELFTRSIRTYF